MKNNTYFFVLNKEKNLSKKKKILSGFWCFKDYSEFHKLKKKKNYFLIKDVWQKYNNTKNDFFYIDKLLKIYSKKISGYLNEFHNVKKNQRYWNILIIPWLRYYIESLLYRWRIVEKALLISKNNLFFYKSSKLSKHNLATNTTRDFEVFANFSERYNYLLFEKILIFFKKKIKFKTKQIVLNHPFKNKKNSTLDRIKLNFFKFIDLIFSFFLKKNSFFFEKEYFTLINYFKLNFFLKQVPFLTFYYFNKILENNLLNNNNYNFLKRKKIIFKSHKKNNLFESFIDNQIRFDIPKCYLENYLNLKKNIKKINIFPELVFSSYKYLHNELFKLWLAELSLNKKFKFFPIEHGGGQQNKFGGAKTELYADKKITWIKTQKKNEHQLPPTNYDLKNNFTIQHKKFLTYVSTPYVYFLNRMGSYTNSFGNVENVLKFKKNLNSNIFDKIRYIPAEIELNLEKNDLIKLLGKKFINERRQLKKFLPMSKIVVCTYPETAFTQSLLNGPTILIKKDFLYLNDKNNDILKSLEENKIFFNNINDAIKHINKIWNNPSIWWNSIKVKKSVKKCLDQFILLPDKKMRYWSNFCKKEISSF